MSENREQQRKEKNKRNKELLEAFEHEFDLPKGEIIPYTYKETLSKHPVTPITTEKYQQIKDYILDKLGITADDWELYTKTIAKIESESVPPTHHTVKNTVEGKRTKVYTVKSKDTVNKIVGKFKITKDDLTKLNKNITKKNKYKIFKVSWT